MKTENHFSSKERSQLRWFCHVQNVPGKIGEASLSCYTHGKVAQRSTNGQAAWLHHRSCLVPSWCGASRTTWDC